jgi:sugar lactone lactonase YvrE
MVTTLAGQAGVKGSADGSGTAATFNNPTNIATDAAGNLYVTDDINSTVRKITPAGRVTTLAGKAGQQSSANGTGSAARFDGPHGIACDATGNVFVSDTSSTIHKITSAGKVTTLAGKPNSPGSADGSGTAARFRGAFGIACNASGTLYIADVDNNNVRKITPAGKVTTLAGKAGQQGSTDGMGAAARFMTPTGIACDAAGNLYVTDSSNNTIRKITPAGKVTTLAGKASSAGSADGMGAAASFNNPTGIACDAAGNLYVTDSDNCAIRKITPAGQVTTVAGKAGSVGKADGSGRAATFNDPTGIACDAAGNLYVCDYGNDTIRKITFSQ